MLLYCISGNELWLGLIINNTSSHYNANDIAICYKVAVFLAYLPSYFSDLNPVEISYLILKHWICWYFNVIESYIEKTRKYARFLYEVVEELVYDR